MTAEHCYGFVCFTPLYTSGLKFFGFSEFLTGLALMVLAWTIADIRYRFRIKTAPLPLQGLTFAMVTAVGVLTLLTDLWRSELWMVPQGNILTPATWQAILGGLFLLTFLTWAWFAFIRPPIYGKMNAKRYAQTLYSTILKGSPIELAIIADELTNSARSLVQYATDHGEFNNSQREGVEDIPTVEVYANEILLLIADKRFCRSIVESSPGTALAVFSEIRETKKYSVQVNTFSKNIVNEALANKDSFLFHEANGYESGLIGYQKPLSQAMFSNHKMVEAIGTLLDPDVWGKRSLDADQWKAYCRVVLMTFSDYVDKGFWNHSYVLYRAMGYIKNAALDLYKINGISNAALDDDVQDRLRVIVDFIKGAVEILDKKGVPKNLPLRIRNKTQRNFFDHFASMIFDVIFSASAVRKPKDLCWWIQHNFVWSEFFNFDSLNGPAGKVMKFKLRRLLYDEVADMKQFPNFKGAKILGFCLNVMGLTTNDVNHDHDSKALQKAILSWTKKNYAWLHSYNPRIAEACLVDGITYDSENLRLIQTYSAEGLRREPHYIYFNVDPIPPIVETSTE